MRGYRFECIVPLKYIEYGVYGDLIIPKAIFYLLKGDCRVGAEEFRLLPPGHSVEMFQAFVGCQGAL